VTQGARSGGRRLARVADTSAGCIIPGAIGLAVFAGTMAALWWLPPVGPPAFHMFLPAAAGILAAAAVGLVARGNELVVGLPLIAVLEGIPAALFWLLEGVLGLSYSAEWYLGCLTGVVGAGVVLGVAHALTSARARLVLAAACVVVVVAGQVVPGTITEAYRAAHRPAVCFAAEEILRRDILARPGSVRWEDPARSSAPGMPGNLVWGKLSGPAARVRVSGGPAPGEQGRWKDDPEGTSIWIVVELPQPRSFTDAEVRDGSFVQAALVGMGVSPDLASLLAASPPPPAVASLLLAMRPSQAGGPVAKVHGLTYAWRLNTASSDRLCVVIAAEGTYHAGQ
jgi:hypothetical protein